MKNFNDGERKLWLVTVALIELHTTQRYMHIISLYTYNSSCMDITRVILKYALHAYNLCMLELYVYKSSYMLITLLML